MQVTMQSMTSKKFFIHGEWIGDFTKTDDWKGFEEWKDKQGRKLYVVGSQEGKPFDLFKFLDQVSGYEPEALEGSIICGHPDLMKMIADIDQWKSNES